jgi:hypothetical protein
MYKLNFLDEYNDKNYNILQRNDERRSDERNKYILYMCEESGVLG